MCRASQINPVIVWDGEEGVGIQAAVSTLMVEVMVVVDSSRTVGDCYRVYGQGDGYCNHLEKPDGGVGLL